MDNRYMRRALALARRGWGQTSPNPMVGAVVVRDGVIVGQGYHVRYGLDHAETVALREAGERALGATVYVTLEPCTHFGQTPPCVDSLIVAGVKRVVVAVRDPNPVAGGGIEKLRAAGIEVDIGVESDATSELVAPFLHSFRSARPWVTLKLAVSLDAALADATGRSKWITGPVARRAAHRLRAGHDAVGIGIGTALADDPMLNVRGVRKPRVAPMRIIFDNRARLPMDSALVRTASMITTLVVAKEPATHSVEALEAAGVGVLTAASLELALRGLRERGVMSLVVEGGARLAGAFLEARGLVDRLIIFQAPLILGSGARNAFQHVSAGGFQNSSRMKVLERRALGEDTMTVYAPLKE